MNNEEIFGYSYKEKAYFSLEADFKGSSYNDREDFMKALQENAANFLEGFISKEGVVFEVLQNGNEIPVVKYFVEEKGSLLQRRKYKIAP